MATEKAPLFDLEAAPSYGATPSVPVGRREQGVVLKEAILKRRKETLQEEHNVKKKKNKLKSLSEHTILYSMLRSHSHRWFAYVYKWFIQALVTITVVNYILETEIYFKICCTPYFNVFEGFVSTFLVLEYIAKVKTAPERKANTRTEAPHHYISFVFSWESLIDIVSFMPFFVVVMLNLNPGLYELQRTLRLVRLFKLPFTWESFRLVGRVMYFNIRILVSSFLVCFIMLLGCSIALFYTRPPVDPKDNFHSILACLYLAVLMLTGQGIPNGVMPWYTRIVISITAIFAIAQFAIPASMLTWGFEQEAERNIVQKHEREKKIAAKLLKGKQLPESSSSSDESDRDSEWEGYLEQVAGSDSDSDSKKSGKSQTEIQKTASAAQLLHMAQLEHALTQDELARAKQIFTKLDQDGDGLCRAEHIRSITDSDQEAQDLLKQLRTFAVGDDVTLRDFICWLSDVKTSYERYGNKVFLRLLNQMETMLSKTKATSTWRRAATAIKVGRLAHKLPMALTAAGLSAPPTAATAEQERLVKMLREQLVGLEGELSSMKKV